MAAYEKAGVDVMIDLNHYAIDPEIEKHRNDACDAMGWCKLALLRGELWATHVTWTPEGEERLRNRKQRYISPVVLQEEDGTAIELFNLALVAMPATYDAQPLVARKNKEIQVSLRKQRYLRDAMPLARRLDKYRSAAKAGKGLQ